MLMDGDIMNRKADLSDKVVLDMVSGTGPDILVNFSQFSQFYSERSFWISTRLLTPKMEAGWNGASILIIFCVRRKQEESYITFRYSSALADLSGIMIWSVM